jgi:hypothetical protein
MKVLSPRAHGIIDYLLVGMLLLAPVLLRFGTAATVISYLTAAVHLAMSLLTDYPLGVSRRIPFSVHGAVEFSIGVGLMACPWLLGFSDTAVSRGFFLFAGALLLIVVLTTRYTAVLFPKREPYDRYGR